MNNLKNLRLLIVEDEQKLSKLLKDAINDFFSSVTIAKNGNEGIKKFKSVKPDIVITDIMMPNCDGLEMTQKIKELNSETPIIILSAHSDKDKLLKAIDLGINKYFIKPFDPEEVLDFLASLATKLEKKKRVELIDDFIYDHNSRSLYKQDEMITLTKREKEFIYMLIQNQNSLVETEDIKKSLWDEDVNDERLRTFIKRLRAKTSKDLIQNLSSQGYFISKL